MKETSPVSVSGLYNHKPVHAQIPSYTCARASANKYIYHTNNIYHTPIHPPSHTHVYTHTLKTNFPKS